jgi:PKHD-type hydroxylase
MSEKNEIISNDMEEDNSKYFDEDGNPIEVRENQIGDHKVASAVLLFEEVLPDYIVDLIEKRINDIEDDEWAPAQVGTSERGAEVPDVRKCEVSWLTELDWVSTIFTHYFRIANRELWEYDIVEMEQIQVTKYDKNNFYGWHSDYGTSGDKNLTRKLSASIVISDPENYSGGKFQYINWMGKVVSATKKRGSIIIFDSRTPHRVTPVLKGQRISLVSWMLGPKLK